MDIIKQEDLPENHVQLMKLGRITIKDDVVLNYIIKPSTDIIFTLREIDDKIIRGPKIRDDKLVTGEFEIPHGSSEANSRVSVRHACTCMKIDQHAASASEISLFKSCSALGCRAPCASVLTGKNAIDLLKIFGRPNQADSLLAELIKLNDPSLQGKMYTPSPDARADTEQPKKKKSGDKTRRAVDDGETPRLKRVRKQPRIWNGEQEFGAEEQPRNRGNFYQRVDVLRQSAIPHSLSGNYADMDSFQSSAMPDGMNNMMFTNSNNGILQQQLQQFTQGHSQAAFTSANTLLTNNPSYGSNNTSNNSGSYFESNASPQSSLTATHPFAYSAGRIPHVWAAPIPSVAANKLVYNADNHSILRHAKVGIENQSPLQCGTASLMLPRDVFSTLATGDMSTVTVAGPQPSILALAELMSKHVANTPSNNMHDATCASCQNVMHLPFLEAIQHSIDLNMATAAFASHSAEGPVAKRAQDAAGNTLSRKLTGISLPSVDNECSSCVFHTQNPEHHGMCHKMCSSLYLMAQTTLLSTFAAHNVPIKKQQSTTASNQSFLTQPSSHSSSNNLSLNRFLYNNNKPTTTTSQQATPANPSNNNLFRPAQPRPTLQATAQTTNLLRSTANAMSSQMPQTSFQADFGMGGLLTKKAVHPKLEQQM